MPCVAFASFARPMHHQLPTLSSRCKTEVYVRLTGLGVMGCKGVILLSPSGEDCMCQRCFSSLYFVNIDAENDAQNGKTYSLGGPQPFGSLWHADAWPLLTLL